VISYWCVQTKNFIGHLWVMISHWCVQAKNFIGHLWVMISHWCVQTKNSSGHLWLSHIDVSNKEFHLLSLLIISLMCSNKEFHWSLLIIWYWCVQTTLLLSFLMNNDFMVQSLNICQCLQTLFNKIKITWLSNLLVLSAPDEGYSRNMFYALNLTSIFFIANCSLLFVFRQNHVT
jgi:hypothetical protein